MTSDDVKLIEEVNADEGVSWLFSFLNADRRRSYCPDQAPSPRRDHRRRQAGGLPVLRGEAELRAATVHTDVAKLGQLHRF